MPADYEIVSVAEGDKWDKDFGQGTQYFQSYDLVLTGPGAPNTPVSLNRKLSGGVVPADKIPQQGQTLYLSINGTKAKEEQRDEQSASNGSSGAVRTDVTGTSIEAQVAAKCAADVLDLSGKTRSQVAEAVEFLTLAFFDAIQKAKQPTQGEIVGGTLQPPSDPEAPGPPVTPTPSDAEIPFRPI